MTRMAIFCMIPTPFHEDGSLDEVTTWLAERESRERLSQLASEVQSRELGLQAEVEDLLTTLENNPDREFVRLVEEALRNLADYAALGQSPLGLAPARVGRRVAY